VKHRLKFDAWWRYISGRKVVENAILIRLPLKWRHQVAKFIFCLIQATLNFLLCYIKEKLFGYLQYPRSGALQKFCGDLKNDQNDLPGKTSRRFAASVPTSGMENPRE